MEETAYAKINLALHVRAREPSGYHCLETIFAFAEDGDLLTVETADELSLAVTGPFAEDLSGENLVLRAAEALSRRANSKQGASLSLDKRLPVASGIGGGSADAAAALRLLTRFWRIDADEALLLGIAAELGADVPACVESVTVRGEGRGDRLRPVDGSALAGLPLLLVNPGVPISTAAVFQAWDGLDRGPLDQADVLAAGRAGRNDLEAPAISVAPEIKAVLAALESQSGALLSRMSGSGATCFALFEEAPARDAARASIAALQPQWWTFATRLR